MNRNQLLKLAEELESPDNEALLAVENDEEALVRVASRLVKAAEALREAAEEMHPAEEQAFEMTPEKLEEIAAVAEAFESSGDELLKKQASVLDDVLFLFASPQSIAMLKNSKEAFIEDLKYQDTFLASDAVKAAKEAILDSPVYKEYRPLEQALSSRVCPEHATPLARVAEGEYQCSLDGKVFVWAEGYGTLKGNKVPGTTVENQNVYDGAGYSYAQVEDSRLERMGLKV